MWRACLCGALEQGKYKIKLVNFAGDKKVGEAETIEADVVIGADGANSRVAKVPPSFCRTHTHLTKSRERGVGSKMYNAAMCLPGPPFYSDTGRYSWRKCTARLFPPLTSPLTPIYLFVSGH